MTAHPPERGPNGTHMGDDMRGLYIWLDERLQQIATSYAESHGRLRNDMTMGFADMRAQFDDVFRQARVLNDRTLIIETERGMERNAGIRVGVIWGAVAGAATSAIMAAVMRVVLG